jgi:predicted secreted protein
MSWTSLVATYAIVWWLVLFTTLPFGVKKPDVTEEGMEPGAPEHPRMWIKAGITTVIAAVITAGIWALIEFKVINFRAAAT